MKRICTVILSALCLVGCRHSDYNAILTESEKLMIEAPDSALTLLQTLSLSEIHPKSLRAKYALLYSQALDKNYIDVDNDSLIRVAVDYFENHGTEQDKYLSLYYLGRVQYNAKDYQNAMLSYLRAKDSAEALEDHSYLGLLYSQVGDIYTLYYNYSKALETFEHAYTHYCQTSLISHRQYALLDIAASYRGELRHDESLSLLHKVIDTARLNADTAMQASCLTLMAAVYNETSRSQKAKEAVLMKHQLLHEPLCESDYLTLAYAYMEENKQDSVTYCLNRANQFVSNDIDHASLLFTKYRINKLRGNDGDAFANLEKCMHVQDSIARQVLMQSVESAQRDYFKKQSEFTTYRLHTNRRVLILLVIIFILVLFSLIIYVVHKMKLKNLEIEEYMNISYEIQNTLQNVQQDMDQKQSRMSNLIQHLFKEQFELINRLGGTYYEHQDTKSEQNAIFDEVKAEIKKLGADQNTKRELEQIVNACKDNIMLKIRAQIPQIKEVDLELLCYLFAGFSHRTIGIFTQDKVANIYTRKCRLRSKITNSKAPDKSVFLDMIL